MVIHDEDCVRVQVGGRGCEMGEEVRGTNIVVMNDAIWTESGSSVQECLSSIPTVSLETFKNVDEQQLTTSKQQLQRSRTHKLCFVQVLPVTKYSLRSGWRT